MNWIYDRGSYVLKASDGTTTVLRTKQPALLYNARSGQLYRHGDYDRVIKYAARMRLELTVVGRVQEALDIVVFTSTRFSLVELNRCVSETGYCLVLQERISRQ